MKRIIYRVGSPLATKFKPGVRLRRIWVVGFGGEERMAVEVQFEVAPLVWMEWKGNLEIFKISGRETMAIISLS